MQKQISSRLQINWPFFLCAASFKLAYCPDTLSALDRCDLFLGGIGACFTCVGVNGGQSEGLRELCTALFS